MSQPKHNLLTKFPVKIKLYIPLLVVWNFLSIPKGSTNALPIDRPRPISFLLQHRLVEILPETFFRANVPLHSMIDGFLLSAHFVGV